MEKNDNSRDAVNDIFRLIDSGQIEHAEKKCQSYLDTNPDDTNILGLLGAILLKLGRTKEAKPVLEKTIGLEPAFAKPYEDLGMLYLNEDNAEQAIRYFEDAIRLDSNQASAYSGLANALSCVGETEAAAEARQKYLALFQCNDIGTGAKQYKSAH